MRGPLRGIQMPKRLKNRPAAVGTKICVVHVQFTAGTQNSKRFLDVGIAIPALQMHKDDGAINQIDRLVSEHAQVVSRCLHQFDVRKLRQTHPRKVQHSRRNIAAYPAPATRREMRSDSSQAASNLKYNRVRIDSHILEKKISRGTSAPRELRLVDRTSDVSFR